MPLPRFSLPGLSFPGLSFPWLPFPWLPGLGALSRLSKRRVSGEVTVWWKSILDERVVHGIEGLIQGIECLSKCLGGFWIG